MEEDKKILKTLLDKQALYYKNLANKEIKAIENILNRLEQLDKESESKEKAYTDCYCDFKHYKQFESVPKSVIRENIKHYEECEEFYGSMETTDKYSDGVIVDEICKVLRKILGDENENRN